jgi:hypothetical protein
MLIIKKLTKYVLKLYCSLIVFAGLQYKNYDLREKYQER